MPVVIYSFTGRLVVPKYWKFNWHHTDTLFLAQIATSVPITALQSKVIHGKVPYTVYAFCRLPILLKRLAKRHSVNNYYATT